LSVVAAAPPGPVNCALAVKDSGSGSLRRCDCADGDGAASVTSASTLTSEDQDMRLSLRNTMMNDGG